MRMRVLGKAIRNESGFTLIEAVASIAVLTCVSWFILQMFIVSAQVNQRAQDQDIASNKALQAIEAFKQADSVAAVKAQQGFASALVVEEDGRTTMYEFYNQNWEPLQLSRAQWQDTQNALAQTGTEEGVRRSQGDNGVVFVMSLEIYTAADFQATVKTLEGKEAPAGALYEGTVSLLNLNKAADKRQILSYQTKKYFSF